jgi:hypothetical protein
VPHSGHGSRMSPGLLDGCVAITVGFVGMVDKYQPLSA